MREVSKFALDEFFRMLLGLVFILIGLAVAHYALHSAPPLSSFFASKNTADGRDAGFCVLLLIIGLGSCFCGLLLMPTE